MRPFLRQLMQALCKATNYGTLRVFDFILNNYQWVFSGVGTIFLSYLLTRGKSTRQTDQSRYTHNVSADEKASSKESQSKNKKIPDIIKLGTTLLRTPTLVELGIPVPFAYLPYIECHVKGGEWVEHGDLLVTFTMVYYQRIQKLPFSFNLIFGDPVFSEVFKLKSPVHGLVTDLRKVTCRESQNDTDGGLFLGVFDDDYVLPTILLPKDEPAWHNSELITFRSQICRSIVNNWKRNQHNSGGGEGRYKRVRFASAIETYRWWFYNAQSTGEVSYEDYDEGLSKYVRKVVAWAESKPCSRDNENIEWPTCDYFSYKMSDEHDSLREHIERYRRTKEDYSLRDKLVHLVRPSENSS